MNNMEEKLWDYIDGTCSQDERVAISALIEKDAVWRTAFNDMLTINDDISALTLDEPSMAFSYNVMEGIRAHEASKPLKTAVSKYIIGGIAGFFILSILLIMVVIFYNTGQNTDSSIAGNLPDLSVLTGAGLINVFFYLDVMLLLFLADAFFRRKRNNTMAKSV